MSTTGGKKGGSPDLTLPVFPRMDSELYTRTHLMSTVTLDEIYSAATLDVVVPDISLEFPQGDHPGEAWLASLTTSDERQQAFFDEQLDFLLVLKFHRSSLLPSAEGDGTPPPPQLLSLLGHLQVSVEATYISPMPFAAKLSPQTPGLLSAPPTRSASVGRLRPRVHVAPPALFPPATPNPTPLTGKGDEQYVKSEGTMLQTFIWGENTMPASREAVVLAWSAKEKVWVLVYRLAVAVLFLRTTVAEPLLCLTVSATLRERALSLPPNHPVSVLLESYGGLPVSDPNSPTEAETQETDDTDLPDYVGLEEVNLLGGLAGGPTFGSPGLQPLSLPSTRLGPSARRRAYNLSPRAAASKQLPAVPIPATARPLPTVRKSFRKTLQTVSAFRVRMRTVFVPYVLLPGGFEGEGDEDEASSEERTVVLCVEIENGGESRMGFAVEGVTVVVGGSGASARLITWGDKGTDDSEAIWPLHIKPLEQFNLLYAVSFMSPSEVEESALPGQESKPQGGAELQRAVAIHIQGRPYGLPNAKDAGDEVITPTFQTHAFSSRWNCVLDLSPHRARDSVQAMDSPKFSWDALPAPASPFPVSSTQTKTAKERLAALQELHIPVIAGSKRHTLGGIAGPRRPTLANWRASTSAIEQVKQRKESTLRLSFTPPPPAINVKAYTSRPNSPGLSTPGSAFMSPPPPPGAELGLEQYATVPQTPAYPAYANSPLPPTPDFQVPLSMQQNKEFGPAIEMRHSGRLPQGGIPVTPGPRMMGGGFFPGDRMATLQGAGGAPIVVSVGLLVNPDNRHLHALDEFTLEIFVFNQSPHIRRFEVSYPDRKRRRQERDMYQQYQPGYVDRSTAVLPPSIMPLENRIRVGPLRPSTCQSVRMQFLAIRPGVHSIDTLVFTDVETGFSMNLRSVADIVVHEGEFTENTGSDKKA